MGAMRLQDVGIVVVAVGSEASIHTWAVVVAGIFVLFFTFALYIPPF